MGSLSSRLQAASCLAALLILLGGTPFVLAQPNTEVSVEIETPFPVLGISAVGDDGLNITWNWDYLSAGFIPGNVSQVRVELSTDAINYGNAQLHPPGDFSSSYTGLVAGTYTAQVTILDGQDVSYIVGPVSLNTSDTSGGRRRTPPSSTPPPVPPPTENLVDVDISGLSYPGPTSVVIMTRDGAFETIIEPDSFGFFDSTISDLPEGPMTFSFSAQDVRGDLSRVLEFDVNLQSPSFALDTVFIPPVVRQERTLIYQGERVQVSGYAYRSAELSLLMEGVTSVAGLTQADQEGYWEFEFLTDDLNPGTYRITATATSLDGSVVSPVSNEVTFELASLLEAAPVCGDAVLDTGEECDDGNTTPGDGCDASCIAEVSLPETALQQPDPDILDEDQVDLSYQVIAQPNGPLESVRVYYSRNGGAYQLYPAVFVGGNVRLQNLQDGVYEVYSIARDSAGYQEAAPAMADATFTVDLIPDFEVLAYPEKRLPPAGNFSTSADLTLYIPGTVNAQHSYQIETDDDGMTVIEVNEDFPQREYHALFKGVSHLSKRLDAVDFSDLNGLVLDFTVNGTEFLLAGDVHPTKDDFINALDISTLVSMLYGSDVVGDLNRDSTINALDLSIMVINLYERGDGIQP